MQARIPITIDASMCVPCLCTYIKKYTTRTDINQLHCSMEYAQNNSHAKYWIASAPNIWIINYDYNICTHLHGMRMCISGPNKMRKHDGASVVFRNSFCAHCMLTLGRRVCVSCAFVSRLLYAHFFFIPSYLSDAFHQCGFSVCIIKSVE